MSMLRYVAAWFPMLALAIANGLLRQAVFAPRMSELRAHQLSAVTGAMLIGVFIRFVIRRWPPPSGASAVGVGLLWLAMTVAFEFFMVLVLMNQPLERALADYNLLAGRVWILFLAWVGAAPWVFYQRPGTSEAR
jgi:hypothetical protein